MCECIVDKITEGITLLATAWIPKKPWVAALATFALWYGRRVALTYAPGFIANYLINATAAYVGVGGAFIGATIVAPLLTPTIVPWVATIAGVALCYIVSVIANIVQKYLFERYCC